MKTLLSLLTMVLLVPVGLASDKSEDSKDPEKPLEFEQLETTEGKTYKGVRVREVTPSGVKIFHEAGAATIPYEELPEGVQKKLGGFDPEKAGKHREQEEATLAANERALVAALQRVHGLAEGKERQEALDGLKMPTKVLVKQMLDGGALCSVSVKVKQKFSDRTPRPLGGEDVRTHERMVWTAYSEEWCFVAGLPTNLVDGSTWEGWTLPGENYSYTSALGARKTVRKLRAVAPPTKR